MSASYEGHMADGSSVQKHSAGPLYPYVVQVRDAADGGYIWEIIGPGIKGALRAPSFDSIDGIVGRLKAWSASPLEADAKVREMLSLDMGKTEWPAAATLHREMIERGALEGEDVSSIGPAKVLLAAHARRLAVMGAHGVDQLDSGIGVRA